MNETMITKNFQTYFIISLFGLIVDFSFYGFMVNFIELRPEHAGALSYIVGLILLYCLMTKYLPAKKNHSKFQGITLFLLSGLFGIFITYIIIFLIMRFNYLDYIFAKVSAIVISFITIYLVRKKVLFEI